MHQAQVNTTDNNSKSVPLFARSIMRAEPSRRERFSKEPGPQQSKYSTQPQSSSQCASSQSALQRRQGTATAQSSSAAGSTMFSRSSSSGGHIDPRLPPRLLIGDRAGVCVRELGAMFSSRGPSGAKIIGRPRTRTRIPLCPVPSLEPKLLASVGKLGFRNGERQQRPDSNSVRRQQVRTVVVTY